MIRRPPRSTQSRSSAASDVYKRDSHVHEGAPGELLVQARRGEVHVAGHDVAGLDEDLRQDVLGGAALVGGHQVLVAVDLPNRRLEVVEVAAAGVGLVAEHHAGPLAVAHGARAGVGEQVDVDVLALQQKGVVAGLADGALAFLAGRHLYGFDHLDPVSYTHLTLPTIYSV